MGYADELPENAADLAGKQPKPEPVCICQRRDVPAPGWEQKRNGKWQRNDGSYMEYDYPRTAIEITQVANCPYGDHRNHAGEVRLVDLWSTPG